MREEWAQGLTRGSSEFARAGLGSETGNQPVKRQRSMQSLTMASRALRLKNLPHASREVSERRQVGDAESLVNPVQIAGGRENQWWRSVSMEEGM